MKATFMEIYLRIVIKRRGFPSSVFLTTLFGFGGGGLGMEITF